MRGLLVSATLAATGCGRVGFVQEDVRLDDASSGFFGSPRCPAGVLLCEDFEVAQIDPARWTASITANGSVGIDTSHSAARGTSSLRLGGNAVPAGTSVDVWLQHFEPGGWPSPTFLRSFVYADGFVPGFVEIVSSLSVSDGSAGVQFEFRPEGQVGLDGWGVALASKSSSTLFPTGRWACIEWEVLPGSPGAMSMWVDEVPIADLQAVPWTTPPQFDLLALRLGYVPNTSTPIELWFDEVIVDGARIGCLN